MDRIDQLIIQAVFKGKDVEKNLDNISKKQEEVIENNEKMADSNYLVEGSQNKLAESGFKLGKAFRLIGLALATIKTVRAAYEWKDLAKTIDLIAESEEKRKQIQEDLFNISQKTGQDLRATVDLYGALALNSRTLGLNEEKRLKLTKLINQAIVAGGGSADEAYNISQALVTGKMSGRNLKTILDNPVLAKSLSKNFNVDVGQLSTMKFSSKDIVNALLKQSKDIESAYTKMPDKIGLAWNKLGNSFQRFAGRLDEITGITNTLSKVGNVLTKTIVVSIEALGKAFDFLAENIVYVKQVLGGLLLMKWQVMLRALGISVAALTGSIGIGLVSALKALAVAGRTALLPFLKFQMIFYLIDQLVKFFKGEENIFPKLAAYFIYAGEKMEEFFLNCIKWLVEELPQKIKGAWETIKQSFKDMLSSIWNALVGWYNKLPSFMKNMFGGDISVPKVEIPQAQSPMAVAPNQNMTNNQNVNITINEATQGKQAYINALDSTLKQTNIGNGYYTSVEAY